MSIIETIFAGRNNAFSLQLVRGDEVINLIAITGYSLTLSNGKVFSAPSSFLEKPDGIVEISIGTLLTEEDLGVHKAFLITYDPVNIQGVRWPTFKLKVQ